MYTLMATESRKTTFSTDREIKLLKALDKDYSLTDERTQGLPAILK